MTTHTSSAKLTHSRRSTLQPDSPGTRARKWLVGTAKPSSPPFNQQLIEWTRDESLSEEERSEASLLLIRRIWCHLASFAASKLPSAGPEELEDIAVDVYIRLLSTTRLTFLTRNLLALIVHDRVIDRKRRESARVSCLTYYADNSRAEDLIRGSTNSWSEPDSLMNQVHFAQIKELIRHPEYEIVWLRNCEERSFVEIADHYNISAANARQRHRRTVQRLRILLCKSEIVETPL